MQRIETHGKHLLRWDNGLTIHSHLRMSGRWRIFGDSRMTFDPYLRRLGPDILAEELEWDAILVRLRFDCRIDPWRPLADVSDEDLSGWSARPAT